MSLCGIALVMFTVVFSILGLIFKGSLGLDSYGAAFWYFLIFGEGLGLFDLLVIDLLWRRNTKRTRFSFLPKKDAYQNPEKHVGSFLRGILLFCGYRRPDGGHCCAAVRHSLMGQHIQDSTVYRRTLFS